jgi:hypothetical protein
MEEERNINDLLNFEMFNLCSSKYPSYHNGNSGETLTFYPALHSLTSIQTELNSMFI